MIRLRNCKNDESVSLWLQSEKICLFPQLIRRVFQRFSPLKLFALFITFFVSVVKLDRVVSFLRTSILVWIAVVLGV